MRCPKCQNLEDKVIDSRISRDGDSIRRRRECLQCGTRFTTYEHVEQADLLVVKRNGAREAFDREKLFRSFIKACEKRPVSHETLRRAAEQIASELEAGGQREAPSQLLGLKVMDKLHSIDPVAYVRYASVYREFQDVGAFINEIESMEHRTPVSITHPELSPKR
ncbi:MAG: transcriptional repressor NrdR [Verrucomicrobiaceae bacterium]|nr:MAG: transcriptional repressor NrdR [Verrucomicrobiaceae bacterium]